MVRLMASAFSLIKKVLSTKAKYKTINIMDTVSKPGTSTAQDMRVSSSKVRKLAKESLNSKRIVMKETSSMDSSMVRANTTSLRLARFMKAR